MNENFAEKLATLRAQKGFTQRELGAMAGVAWSMISKYEAGQSMPRLKVLMRLAEALDVTVDELRSDRESAREHGEISFKVPGELYKRLEEAAAEANMTMDEYGEFFLARMVSWAYDETLGIREPSIYTKEQVAKAQSRMKPGEREKKIKKRLQDLKDRKDDESVILAEIWQRQELDGRSPKKG
ncbi:helix-turn-helix domain-containing protein [Pseudomonas chlororaphis]